MLEHCLYSTKEQSCIAVQQYDINVVYVPSWDLTARDDFIFPGLRPVHHKLSMKSTAVFRNLQADIRFAEVVILRCSRC